jgi:beta-lactamase regulating signal transducer with metallopeptidase domain
VTCAVLLAVYAVGAGLLSPPLLRRDWTVRAPGLAIIAWLTLPASCVAAAVLAGVAVAVPMPLSWHMAAAGGAPWPGYPVLSNPVAIAGLLLAAAIVTRAGCCLVRDLARGRRERREHAAFLAAAGRADHTLGAVVLDEEAPAAYCLPGGRHRVVVSAGALAALQPAQLQAVLAHERAHLRGHHHAMLTWARALGRALPMVPLLAQAGPRLAELAEMAADDAAVRRHAPGDLAAALVILARTGARATVLAVGGTAAVTRVQRLLAPAPRPGRPARLAGAAVALIIPALVASLMLLVAACDASHP